VIVIIILVVVIIIIIIIIIIYCCYYSFCIIVRIEVQISTLQQQKQQGRSLIQNQKSVEQRIAKQEIHSYSIDNKFSNGIG